MKRHNPEKAWLYRAVFGKKCLVVHLVGDRVGDPPTSMADEFDVTE